MKTFKCTSALESKPFEHVQWPMLIWNSLTAYIEVTNKEIVTQRVIGCLIDVITKLWVVIVSIMWVV